MTIWYAFSEEFHIILYFNLSVKDNFDFIIFQNMKYKKRLLLRYIHHFKSDLINNMTHMRISGT